MADIIPFKKPTGKRVLRKGNILCRRGFHKWQVVNERVFDVKAGKLVTHQRCARCGDTRTFGS